MGQLWKCIHPAIPYANFCINHKDQPNFQQNHIRIECSTDIKPYIETLSPSARSTIENYDRVFLIGKSDNKYILIIRTDCEISRFFLSSNNLHKMLFHLFSNNHILSYQLIQ